MAEQVPFLDSPREVVDAKCVEVGARLTGKLSLVDNYDQSKVVPERLKLVRELRDFVRDAGIEDDARLVSALDAYVDAVDTLADSMENYQPALDMYVAMQFSLVSDAAKKVAKEAQDLDLDACAKTAAWERLPDD